MLLALARHLPFVTTWYGVFLIQLVFGLILTFGLSALSFQFFFVWKKQRFFGDRDLHLNPAEIADAKKMAVLDLMGNAVLATPLQWAIVNGYGKVYLDIHEHSWAYTVFSFFAWLLITEFFVYWAHRILHWPWMNRHIHKYHHKYYEINPWVSYAFHPLDSFMQAVPHYVLAFFLPVHASIYAGYVVFLMIWTFSIHDRVSLVRLGIINYAAHHTLHHLYNRDNYGQFLTLFDRIFGSYRDPIKEKRFEVMFPAAEDAAASGSAQAV